MVNSCGLEVFIAASLKYPELNAVKYQVDREKIVMEVVLKGKIDHRHKTLFSKKLRGFLSLLHKLSGKEPSLLELDFKEISDVTFLRFHRDVNSLTEEEIGLFVMLLREDFKSMLFSDKSSIIAADSSQKKIKRDLLQKITECKNTTKFFAYREQGKVFLFNE